MQDYLEQNSQEDRRGFLKNLGITLLGASALANVSLDNYFFRK